MSSDSSEDNDVLCTSDELNSSEPEHDAEEGKIGSAIAAAGVAKSSKYSPSPSHDDGIASSCSGDHYRLKKTKRRQLEDTTIVYGRREKGIRCVTVKIYENSEWWDRISPFNLGPFAGDLHQKMATKRKRGTRDPDFSEQPRTILPPKILATRPTRIEIPESLLHVFEINSDGIVEMKSPFIRWWNKLADAATENWITTQVLQRGTTRKAVVIKRNADLDPPDFYDLGVAAWNFLRRLACKGQAHRVLIFEESQIREKIDRSFVKLFCILAKRSRSRGFDQSCLDFPVVCERDGDQYRSRCWFCFRFLTVVGWSGKETLWNRLTNHLSTEHDQTEKLKNLIDDAEDGTSTFSFFDYLVALQHAAADLYVLRRALEVDGHQLHFDEDPPSVQEKGTT